jgi:signal transduction histidine kinase/HAMP domain-containing protein
MRVSLRTKQVLGVTALVGAVVAGLSVHDLAEQARVRLEESDARGQLLARAIYQRAFTLIPDAPDPYAALRDDGGVRAILESSIYSKGVTYAAIVDANGTVIAQYPPEQISSPMRETVPLLSDFVNQGALEQLKEIFFGDGRTFEVREDLKIAGVNAVTRIGVSTLLVRSELQKSLYPVLVTASYLLIGATLGALLLSQWLLRPIHVLRSGLRRLERGEPAAALDLPQDEFGEMGQEIRAVSEKLLAGREATGPEAGLDSIVEHLADAVGIFSPNGDVLFANPALRALLAACEHEGRKPFDSLVDRTHDTRESAEPVTMSLPSGESEGGTRDWLVTAHPVEGPDERLLGVMIVARDVGALGAVESTIKYSRKLAALGRLTSGVAHEVKNPLNAMTIHLELLKGKLTARVRPDEEPASSDPALDHVAIIGNEIKRLDQVVQGFLKFMRPEDLRLQPVAVDTLLHEIAKIVEPDAANSGVRVHVECPASVPDVRGDPGSLRQALLNLSINACQAMTHGGTLRLTGRAASRRRVEITVEDTGRGIKPTELPRIFDLYFTTKDGGSGIGLSMVYRTVQMHDGEIEVQSTLGTGTTFRILLPQT